MECFPASEHDIYPDGTPSTVTPAPPKRRKVSRVPKEATIVTAILKWLKTVPNVRAKKTHGGGFTSGGEPDISGAVGPVGLRFEIEVKRSKGGVLSDLQRATIAQWSAVGVATVVVTSLEQAQAFLAPVLARARRLADLEATAPPPT